MSGPETRFEHILVIKHGSLGDFVQALGPMKAIRAHHLGSRITLLTSAGFAELARASGWFDAVWIDERPGPFEVGGWLGLRRRLREGGFTRVYDLQTSTRSGAYFRLFPRGARPEWSGIAKGCSHPHDNPDRVRLHTLERQADQLAVAGINFVPPPDVSSMRGDISRFSIHGRFALLVAGGSAHRPKKRWPAESYVQLAWRLSTAGIRPLLVGAAAEREVNGTIARAHPKALDLTGRTDFTDIVELARRAEVAVGNDTGPMHLVAATTCPTVVLFSSASDPALCAPRGPAVTVLRRADLDNLEVDEVAAAAELE